MSSLHKQGSKRNDMSGATEYGYWIAGVSGTSEYKQLSLNYNHQGGRSQSTKYLGEETQME